MFIFFALLAGSIVGFLIHLALTKEKMTKKRFVELMLLYQIVFSLGLTSLLAFIGFTFMPEYIAKFTNWPACPFEQQMGNVNLGYAVLGIMCIWFRGNFWIATIIGFSIWILSDGFAHLSDMIRHNNYSPGNVGVPLYTDFIVPIVLLILLFLHIKLDRKAYANNK